MKTFLLLFLTLFSFIAAAQNNTVDSLKNLLKMGEEDTNRVNILKNLVAEFRYSNTDTATYYNNEALALAKRLNFEMGIADAKMNACKLFSIGGNYTEGIKVGHEALISYNKLLVSANATTKANILFKIARCYNALLLNFFPEGNYPEALKVSFSELKIWEQLKDNTGISNAQFNIANIYYCQHNFSKALEHHFASLAINQQLGDKVGISGAYSAIGLVYFDQGNFGEASKYYALALKLGIEINDSTNLAEIYVNMIQLEYKKKNYNEALKYGFAALNIYEKIGLNFNIPFALNNMAMVYMKQKRYTTASEYLIKALAVSKETNHLEYIKMSYENLTALDSLEGNYKQAYNHYKLYILYRDSLSNEETQKKSLQAQMQYEFDKKEDALKAAQVQKDIITNAAIKNQRTVRNFSFAGTFLILSFGSYSFYRFRKRKKLQSQQEMLNERLRISRELHDDIGSTLGSISIYTEVAKNRADKKENSDEVIAKIGTASRELIEKMSDIVWSLNPNNESFEQLQHRMQAYAAMLLTPQNIAHNFTSAQEINQLQLTNEERKNIFLIFKEAIYNAAKYAQCQNVNINMNMENGSFKMLIQDDGKGFDAAEISAYNGNGIKNMQARAKEMNATLIITSEINGGTSIALTPDI